MSEMHDAGNSSSLFYYDELASTNSQMRQLLMSQRLNELSVVLTGYQVAGRGQGGNRWESERGKNLLMSVLLYPHRIEIHKQFGISVVVSLAVADVVTSYGIASVRVKWPNDIYVDDRKVAGILIEHSIMGPTLSDSIAGIGLNVNQRCFVSDAPNPVSMGQILNDELALDEVFDRLLANLEVRYEQLLTGGEEALLADYHDRMWRADGQLHRFRDEQGEFDAIIVGVDEIGRLVLNTSAGEERVYGFKEVEYLK